MADQGKIQTPADSKGSVLVVDDSRLVRMVVARALRAGGFHAEEAETGADALRLLAKTSFDVVITDLNMPGLDGFEVLAAVKRINSHVEVIILTGAHAQDMSSAVRALRLGAHDYLTKPPSNAEEVVLTVERATEKKRLKDANRRLLAELEALSRTDALTGVANRRTFDDALGREVTRTRRHGRPFGVVMLDIDHFKNVNDTHGHQGGDDVLRVFARAAAEALRDGDTLYRYGGEEFAVLLLEADLAGAMSAAERIVAAVAAAPVVIKGVALKITTSAGVSCWTPATRDGADLVAKADAALYEAKTNGRNRAVAHGTRPPALTLVRGGVKAAS